jgi:hypothetical protein
MFHLQAYYSRHIDIPPRLGCRATATDRTVKILRLWTRHDGRRTQPVDRLEENESAHWHDLRAADILKVQILRVGPNCSLAR